MLLVSLNIEHILSGIKSTAHHTGTMGPPAAAAVREWRSDGKQIFQIVYIFFTFIVLELAERTNAIVCHVMLENNMNLVFCSQ